MTDSHQKVYNDRKAKTVDVRCFFVFISLRYNNVIIVYLYPPCLSLPITFFRIDMFEILLLVAKIHKS